MARLRRQGKRERQVDDRTQLFIEDVRKEKFVPEETKSFEQIAASVLEGTPANDSVVQPQRQAQESQTEVTPPIVDSGETSTPAGDQPAFLQKLSELGFTDISDEQSAQDRLLEAYAQDRARLQELQDQMEYLRLQRVYEQQKISPQPNPQTQHQQQNVDQQPRNYWDIKIDETRVAPWLTRDENGDTKLKPETPADIRSQWEAREFGKQQWVQSLLNNPNAALAPILQQQQLAMEQRFQELLQQKEMEQNRQTALQDFTEKNQWIYQLDPVTQQPRMGRDGAPVLSDAGVKFDSILTGLIDKGLPEDVAIEAAQGLYATRFGAVNQQATKQAIAQNRIAHVASGNAAAAQRNGHSSAVASGKLTGAALNRDWDFAERFAEHLGAGG